MAQGYLLLVLHAHLPYVRHPEHDFYLEEMWFYEAITETYIPLIKMMDRFLDEGVDFRLTMSITPTLAAMLTDGLLQERYNTHINKLIELAEKEVDRTRWQPEFHRVACMYRDSFYQCRSIFNDKYHRNLTIAFKKFQDAGKLEIITCGATHGFLPNMETVKQSVKGQIRVACDYYRQIFGRSPRGIWLPECGYNPGDDKILAENGIQYFFCDTHALLHGTPRPKYGVFAPVFCPSGVAAFARDVESSKQVWSAEEGYPGDADYREFYRDIGYDSEYEYIRPYIAPDGIRVNTGIKYYRITGKSHHKEPYNPHNAWEKSASHAGNFMFNRERQVEWLGGRFDRKPIVVAPYDAELFGHWWFEGPFFLEHLMRKIHFDSKVIKMITAPEYLREYPKNQVLTPSFSSWGYKGFSEVWLEGTNDWIYRHLHEASWRMRELANSYKRANGMVERALKQAARELLLAESSDWAFILKTGTMVEYAKKRTIDHVMRFTRLYWDIKNNTIDGGWLSDIESKDNIFPNIDYRVYAS
jgi:1,4-alpha-glucan branching enzyme